MDNIKDSLVTVLLLLMGLGLGAAIWLSDSAMDDATGLIEYNIPSQILAKTADASFFDATVDAKDFLRLRDKKYVVSANAKLVETIEDMELILTLEPSPSVETKAKEIHKLLEQYQVAFNTIVDLNIAKGLTENEGLQGEFRMAVHAIEASVKEQDLAELTISMLMSRRHEKDYMLRGDKKYLGLIAEEIERFEQQMEVSTLSVAFQVDMMKQWHTYYDGINKLAKIDDKINQNIKNFDSIFIQLENNIHQIESLLEQNTGQIISPTTY